MIKPHASDTLTPCYVSDATERQRLLAEAENLPSLLLSSAAAANAVMLGAGYFTPLTGYMNKADALCVADNLHTTSGLFWPIPILCLNADADAFAPEQLIALRDPNVAGQPPLAVMQVEQVENLRATELNHLSQKIYATTDPAHPGVAAFLAQGNTLVSGPIEVLNYSYFATEFADIFRTAPQIRQAIAANGWHTVVAFQTRNPMHLAHEELCRIAMQRVAADGCVIHMLLGKLKSDDIPAEVRVAAINKMVELYFPANSVMVSGYGFDMLYAGPREAILHAIFRQNMGATHFIIGRDHAGVGDYYGDFAAQTIFDTDVPRGALEIDIFRADHTAYSKKLNKVLMMCEAPAHTKEDFVLLSGTRVREMLSQGITPPAEFTRAEVAQILIDYYRSRKD